MRALLLTEYKNLVLADMEPPQVAADEVLVRVKACGICGSDVHGYDGASGRRIPPLVMGHEAAGVVESVGDNVTGFAVGDRVTFDSTVSCGKCYFCNRGDINLCDNRMVLGVSCGDYRRHGCFAEYVNIPERILYKLPDDFPFEHAAMIEAVSIAVHAVNRTPVVLGDTAVVVGAGMIGALVVQALRTAGCGTIIVLDIDSSRLEMVKEHGADIAIDSSKEDAVARVLEITGGRGADVAVEAVGATAPIRTAIDCVRKGGAVTLVGNITPDIELPLQAVVTRELSINGSCASSGEYPACIELMARGDINVAPLISAESTLEEAADWFDRLYKKEPGLLKVVVKP